MLKNLNIRVNTKFDPVLIDSKGRLFRIQELGTIWNIPIDNEDILNQICMAINQDTPNSHTCESQYQPKE